MKSLLVTLLFVCTLLGTAACGAVMARQPIDSTPQIITEMETPTATAQSPTSTLPAATPEQIPYKDIAYEIDGRQVRLVDGSAEEEAAPGSASKITTRYLGKEAFGDLSGEGDEDVAFVLTQNSGGSGTFYYIAAAYKTGNGYAGSNAVLLGDRIDPRSTAIVNEMVEVKYADRAPGESFADQPSVDVTRYFSIKEGRLVEINLPAQITNRTWKWVRTQLNDGTVYSPIQQDAFTITFDDTGKVSGTTDCNNFFGSYTVQDNLLSFGPFASTKMYCEVSQEGVFVKYLAEVQSFLMVDNQLVLEIRYDSGQVIFE